MSWKFLDNAVEGWEDLLDSAINILKKRVIGLFSATLKAGERAIDRNKDKFEGDVGQYIKDASKRSVLVGVATPGSYVARGEAALAALLLDLATQGIELLTHEAKIFLEDAYAEYLAIQAEGGELATGEN